MTMELRDIQHNYEIKKEKTIETGERFHIRGLKIE